MALGQKTHKVVETGRVPKSIRDAFRPAIELEHVAGLKVAVYSRAKVGKTHLAFTCPLPIYGIDTEGSWALNKNQFSEDIQRQVHVAQVLFMAEKEGGKVDLVASLDAARDALDSLTDYISCNDRVEEFLKVKGTATLTEVLVGITNAAAGPWNDQQTGVYIPNQETVEYVLEELVQYGCSTKEGELYKYVNPFPRGTIVIDSGTDIWDWLGIWKDEQNFTEPGRLQWGHANKRYNEFIIMMLHSKWNVLGSFKAEAMVDTKGGDLLTDKPKWQKKTDYWFDVIIELKSMGPDRQAIFRGDRFGGNIGTLLNPTWQDIVTQLESKKKVKVK
jgi:hypothetical protein